MKEKNKEPWAHECEACGGHNSFWNTVVQSPWWKLWCEEQSRRMFVYSEWITGRDKGPEPEEALFDTDECTECGWISSKHFEEFIKFIVSIYETTTNSK